MAKSVVIQDPSLLLEKKIFLFNRAVIVSSGSTITALVSTGL